MTPAEIVAELDLIFALTETADSAAVRAALSDLGERIRSVAKARPVPPPRHNAPAVAQGAPGRADCPFEPGRHRLGKPTTAPPEGPSEVYMPFGQYKDRALAEIAEFDPGYLEWLLGRQIGPSLRRCIEYALGRRTDRHRLEAS
jgi:hypothetical protein